MRQIKFRVWDESRKKMHAGNPKFVEFKINSQGELSASNYNPKYELQMMPIMQFTGLKDVNGVEIYDGDYVSIFSRDDNEFMMCGVVKFGFRGYPGFDIYTRGDNTYSDEYNTFTNDDDLYFKVVGNKYQNPELLK